MSRGTLGWIIALALGSCAEDPRGGSPPEMEAVQPAPRGVVDSIFPVEEEIRRFREGLAEVGAFSGGARSRDQLVERFVAAVERADPSALGPLVLDRSEFGWLYYPHTAHARPPYRLSPGLLWFQMQNRSSRSLTRLFRRLAGSPLHVTGYRCEEEPRREGPQRVWDECRLILDPPGGAPYEIRLFGGIVERDGTVKFVSYASDL